MYHGLLNTKYLILLDILYKMIYLHVYHWKINDFRFLIILKKKKQINQRFIILKHPQYPIFCAMLEKISVSVYINWIVWNLLTYHGCFKRSRLINSNFKHTCVHQSKLKCSRTTSSLRNNQCRNDSLCKRLT